MNTGQQQFSVHPEEFGASGHDCEVCFNGPEATPMTAAFVALSIPPHQRHHMLNLKTRVGEELRSLFILGWEVGVEGNLDEDTPMDRKLFGYNRVDFAQAIKAWMLGFVAGRYAHQFGWQSAVCKLGDPAEHALITPLDMYAADVRAVGKFPVNFEQNPHIRGLLQVCLDADNPPRVAAAIIAKAIELGAVVMNIEGFNRVPAPSSALNPDQFYDTYARNLDERSPGWHWSRLEGMSDGLAREATKRRLRSTGEHGYKDNPDRLVGCEINEAGLVITWIPRQG